MLPGASYAEMRRVQAGEYTQEGTGEESGIQSSGSGLADEWQQAHEWRCDLVTITAAGIFETCLKAPNPTGTPSPTLTLTYSPGRGPLPRKEDPSHAKSAT